MGKQTSVVELNGNQYDAVSGQLIGAVKRVTNRSRTAKIPVGANIDGFMKQPAAKAIRQYATKAKSSVAPIISQTAQNMHKGAQRSRTLMRGTVRKPEQAVETRESKPQKAKTVASSADRILRSRAIAKNNHVSRFARPFGRQTKELNASKIRAAEVGEVLTSKPVKAASTSSASLSRPLPSMVTSASHQHLERLLDQALFRADAHKKALHRAATGNGILGRIKRAPRWISVGATVLAVLLLGGFFAWQNMPQVSLKVASSRAHLNASVPAYTPSGFSFSKVSNPAEGSVSIHFKADIDADRSFTVTQKASTMDSASLAASAIPKDMAVQTSQVNGTTIYVYGQNNNATWVNHGVVYKIEDKAKLDTDQLLRIANSLP